MKRKWFEETHYHIWQWPNHADAEPLRGFRLYLQIIKYLRVGNLDLVACTSYLWLYLVSGYKAYTKQKQITHYGNAIQWCKLLLIPSSLGLQEKYLSTQHSELLWHTTFRVTMRNNAKNILKSQVPFVPSLHSPWNDSTITCAEQATSEIHNIICPYLVEQE